LYPKSLKGKVWEELVKPVAEKWLLEQMFMNRIFAFLIRFPSDSKLDFHFKTRKNDRGVRRGKVDPW